VRKWKSKISYARDQAARAIFYHTARPGCQGLRQQNLYSGKATPPLLFLEVSRIMPLGSTPKAFEVLFGNLPKSFRTGQTVLSAQARSSAIYGARTVEIRDHSATHTATNVRFRRGATDYVSAHCCRHCRLCCDLRVTRSSSRNAVSISSAIEAYLKMHRH
jgi:hypothetical protein